jgi:hypothetical protein
VVDDLGSALSTAGPPPLGPPLLEVGYNYTWPFNRYGTSIGPRDISRRVPTGASDEVPVFRDPARHPPAGSLARNLAILRDELKIRKVRMFLMGNAFNYGPRPGDMHGDRFSFEAPASLHPLFLGHFRQMLRVFKDNGAELLPSLLDFGAFFPLGHGMGGGRASILTSQRRRFIETVLKPLLAVSRERGLDDTVFAWEVVNEPIWNTISAPPLFDRPHTSVRHNDVARPVMASFLADCIDVIRAEGFRSTVGHRFFRDLTSEMPSGDLPQFHYYGATSFVRRAVGLGDPRKIPNFSGLAADVRTRGAFVGELAVAPGGDVNEVGDVDAGAPWPECRGRDGTRSHAAFERLTLLARKGYELAFVWPDRSDKESGIVIEDALKLTPEAQESIRLFTHGRFPGGVP